MAQSTDIIQWNCEGLLPKKGDLEVLISEKNPLCVCLQETKLPFNSGFKLAGLKSFLENLQ